MNMKHSQCGANGNSLKSVVDVIKFERRQRQFLNELAMKRAQVDELKRELDTANLKIHDTTRELDVAKNTIDEQQRKLNLAVKNVRFFEDRLQAKRDSAIKTHVQQESAVSERDNLRELLQKAEIQNFAIMQELNELKAQHKCDLAYQKELMIKDSEIRSKTAKLTEVIEKFQFDEKALIQLMNKVQTWDHMQGTVGFYQQELQKYKYDYHKLEEKYIIANAAMESFHKLTTDNQDCFNADHENQIIISQWTKAAKWFADYTKTQKEVLENLRTTLNNEKETNMKICIREAELEAKYKEIQKENEQLKKTLSKFSVEHQAVATQTNDANTSHTLVLKNEIVEVVDN